MKPEPPWPAARCTGGGALFKAKKKSTAKEEADTRKQKASKKAVCAWVSVKRTLYLVDELIEVDVAPHLGVVTGKEGHVHVRLEGVVQPQLLQGRREGPGQPRVAVVGRAGRQAGRKASRRDAGAMASNKSSAA